MFLAVLEIFILETDLTVIILDTMEGLVWTNAFHGHQSAYHEENMIDVAAVLISFAIHDKIIGKMIIHALISKDWEWLILFVNCDIRYT